jgi:hypothetical protein
MDYDIFFSYPHKDAEEVKHILQGLQAEGLKVWIDKSENRDFASITNSIVVGLAHSRVLLAYYSQNYWRSRACQWELTAGFLAAQREGDPRKRALVINPDDKAEHIHPVELRDELFQIAPKDAEALKKLVRNVKNHVSGIKCAIGEINTLTQPQWRERDRLEQVHRKASRYVAHPLGTACFWCTCYHRISRKHHRPVAGYGRSWKIAPC